MRIAAVLMTFHIFFLFQKRRRISVTMPDPERRSSGSSISVNLDDLERAEQELIPVVQLPMNVTFK
jgi:hypothetical protein